MLSAEGTGRLLRGKVKTTTMDDKTTTMDDKTTSMDDKTTTMFSTFIFTLHFDYVKGTFALQ